MVRRYPNFRCEKCNKAYYLRPSTLLVRKKKYNTIFCNSCRLKSYKVNHYTIVICFQCNKEFYRKKGHCNKATVRRWKNSFCGHSCRASYNNTHKTYGYRRSKLEIALEAFIRKAYPKLQMVCNSTSAINNELDFYFPSLNLAVEINGVFHYKPIFGIKKLLQVQATDKKKIIACENKNILLVTISPLEKHCTKGTIDKYTTIMEDLINSRGQLI